MSDKSATSLKIDLYNLPKSDVFETPNETNRTSIQNNQKFFSIEQKSFEFSSPRKQQAQIVQINRLNGDLMKVDPESDRIDQEKKQRKDKFGQIIIKGSKFHKISFRDLVSNKRIKDIFYFEKNVQIDDEQDLCCCHCCVIQ